MDCRHLAESQASRLRLPGPWATDGVMGTGGPLGQLVNHGQHSWISGLWRDSRSTGRLGALMNWAASCGSWASGRSTGIWWTRLQRTVGSSGLMECYSGPRAASVNRGRLVNHGQLVNRGQLAGLKSPARLGSGVDHGQLVGLGHLASHGHLARHGHPSGSQRAALSRAFLESPLSSGF